MKHPKGTVYLLHFDKPFKHARHYLGWTQNLPARLATHGNGNGARLIKFVTEAGIRWQCVRTWEGVPKSEERQLKRQHGAVKLCPVCRAEKRGTA